VLFVVYLVAQLESLRKTDTMVLMYQEVFLIMFLTFVIRIPFIFTAYPYSCEDLLEGKSCWMLSLIESLFSIRYSVNFASVFAADQCNQHGISYFFNPTDIILEQ